jgi:phospholipase C
MENMLDKVKTIVLLMFENRSFDHMLGHLSRQQINPDVRGLKDPLTDFNNLYKGGNFPAYPIREDVEMNADLPHSREGVGIQLKKHPLTGNLTMGGFVEAYANATQTDPNKECEPMGFFESPLVPATSFLARTFCTCDNWFCPLPTGTQPNRNMAFSGESAISENGLFLKIGNNNIFDWLNRAGGRKRVRWRVYHSGMSFFTLYPSLLDHVFGSKFRRYDQLASDILSEPEETSPEVIIVEPVYQDAPHITPTRANDNHPPLAIGWGEEFLRRTYEAISCNPKKWESTVFMVYYDEHGGFYDHVSPPKIGFRTGDEHQFETTGPRIPAIIASPLVKPGSVCHQLFDHTSILQLLAEKFTPGRDYSDRVKERRLAGVKSISEALDNDAIWPAPPPPAGKITVPATLGSNILEGPQTEVAESFEATARDILANRPAQTAKKFPELVHWKIATENALKPTPDSPAGIVNTRIRG